MTNPQKKNSEELLVIWTILKEKLSKFTYLYQKRSLIKDALEIYLNQSSSFLSEHNNPLFIGGSEEAKRVYQSQKEKNEKIIKECKELLEKLASA